MRDINTSQIKIHPPESFRSLWMEIPNVFLHPVLQRYLQINSNIDYTDGGKSAL
jgi:hypothetical protein